WAGWRRRAAGRGAWTDASAPPAVQPWFRVKKPYLRSFPGDLSDRAAGAAMGHSAYNRFPQLISRGVASMNTRLVLIAAAVLPLAGCMRAHIDGSREVDTRIADAESVVVLAKPQIEAAGAESEFLDCIAYRIAGRRKNIKVHPNEE